MTEICETKSIYNRLANDKISSVFWQYALPAIIGTVVNTVYSIIDGIFIGHWVGKEALAGLGVILPVMNLLAAAGMLVGVGSASRISIALGKGDRQMAEKIAGTSFLLTLVLSTSLNLILLIFLKPVLMFVGASEHTFFYARDFLKIFLPGSVILSLSFNFNNMMRACGYPLKAMLTMCISVVANIILAPVFILILGMGMQGAALATVISMTLSFIFVMQHFLNKKSDVRLYVENLKLKKTIVRSIISIGLSSFLIQTAASAVVVLINFQLHAYAKTARIIGDEAIAAFSNANRLIMLVVMIVIGMTQGMQPIIGYNYGARNHSRVVETLFYTIKVATLITFGGFIIAFLFPEYLVNLFSTDQELVFLSAKALKYLTLGFTFIGFQIVATSFFQCIGMAKQAVFLSLSRQVLILLPVLWIFPEYIGFDGVWLSNPIADILASGITGLFLYEQLKQFRKRFMKMESSFFVDNEDSEPS